MNLSRRARSRITNVSSFSFHLKFLQYYEQGSYLTASIWCLSLYEISPPSWRKTRKLVLYNYCGDQRSGILGNHPTWRNKKTMNGIKLALNLFSLTRTKNLITMATHTSRPPGRQTTYHIRKRLRNILITTEYATHKYKKKIDENVYQCSFCEISHMWIDNKCE